MRPERRSSTGEFDVISRLLPMFPSSRDVQVGPGDDCAVVRAGGRSWLMTVDCLVEGTHFLPQWLTPVQLGRKAFLVNASDIAAMGGSPRWCLVNVCCPPRLGPTFLTALHRGIASAAEAGGAFVVGGNLASAPLLSVAITVIGNAPVRPILRSGAHAGDAIFVTGRLGDAALGVRRLRGNPRDRTTPVRRFREPPNRIVVGRWLAANGIASAMIDVSDGLVQDLGHVCRASRLGAIVEATLVPCSSAVRREGIDLALCGGEDYELLFTVPKRKVARLQAGVGDLGCELTRIGEMTSGDDGVHVLDATGRQMEISSTGFDHFRAR